MATQSKPAVITAAPATAPWRDKLKEAAGRIVRDGPPSDPEAAEDDGSIPPGGGSAPIANDPAVTDPLGHLEDIPGVSEESPTPGEGLPDVPPPEPPAPPAPVPPPPAAKGI